jgi:beta-galactosidase GanA
MNVIRIGESTWSTWEPEDGAFDFSLLVRTIEKASDYGLQVLATPQFVRS